MVYPATPLVVRIYLFVSGAWLDVTLDVYARDQIAVTWGRQDWASTADTTKCPLTFNNGESKAAPGIVGRYSRRNTSSDLYGQLSLNTPVRVDLVTPAGTVAVRFEGHISSWPTRWDVSGKDVYTKVTANGVRRRLAQGKKLLKDPLRRHIQSAGPLNYWPLTDGESAIQGSEVMQGSQPVRAIGKTGAFFQGQPDWGKGTLAAWLDSVVALPANTEGSLTTRLPKPPPSRWTCDHVRAGVGGQEDDLTVYDNAPGTDAQPITAWLVVANHTVNQVQLRVVSAGETASSLTALATINNPGIFDLLPHLIRLTVMDNGATAMDWELFIDGQSVASGTHAIPYRPATRIRYRWGAFASLTEPLALGHLALWETPPAAIDTWRAVQGYARERAGRRIERLCAEERVALEVNGDLDLTTPMGPQKSGSFLDLLQSAADVDGGALYESREMAGLAYRTRVSKYNQGL
ncbi:hypothetical protein ACIQPS_08900 [Streptomyces sp. NPDC091290]|uniref:hypothetical protein n=1 Tax=Streptomyces sp. NPDC091290 TaxID=3365990 RepID=UPI003812A9D9